MNTKVLREQLQEQIKRLPDDILEQVADFTLFMMSRRKIEPLYEDWKDRQWQDFVLSQFFSDEDDVEYALEDAQEVYHP